MWDFSRRCVHILAGVHKITGFLYLPLILGVASRLLPASLGPAQLGAEWPPLTPLGKRRCSEDKSRTPE